jgi:N-acylneuraminate cytidylyltransferase/CMP-N,N'-diacetyllegionaminic acid synthase
LKILALIPARGGSKGIPRKNIKPLAGKPLIGWTIEAALQSGSIASVVVSTEDEEIAEVARRHGAQVPFLRPAELAQDNTPSIDPVLHAIDQFKQHDFLLLLQPTSPLRTVEDIDACIRLAADNGAQSVVSVSEPGTHPYWMYRLGPDQRLTPLLEVEPVSRRQDLPPVYAPNGAIYLVHIESLRRHRRFVTTESMAYIMPPERSVDLDNMLDWKLAELLFKERH